MCSSIYEWMQSLLTDPLATIAQIPTPTRATKTTKRQTKNWNMK